MAAALFINVRQPRNFRHSAHLMDMNNTETHARYRFTNEGIDFLENMLHDDLIMPTNRNRALSVRVQLYIALRFFATGAIYSVIGDTMGFDKSTVSRTVDRVTTALISHLREFIHWPEEDERQRVMDSFYQLAGFPNVVGCIDGTHVRIQAPNQDEASYVNRKGYHSINVQAVCDDRGMFTSINASWPGSCHDSHIFRTSGLCQKLEQQRQFSDGVLLGDSGYPCRPFLMTPYLVTDTVGKERYQRSHTRTRVTIERAFGQLKRRFHVLHGEVRLSPVKACRITTACAILNNIAILLNEPEVGNEDQDQDQPLDNYVGVQGDGNNTRAYIVQNFFT